MTIPVLAPSDRTHTYTHTCTAALRKHQRPFRPRDNYRLVGRWVRGAAADGSSGGLFSGLRSPPASICARTLTALTHSFTSPARCPSTIPDRPSLLLLLLTSGGGGGGGLQREGSMGVTAANFTPRVAIFLPPMCVNWMIDA